MSNFETGAKATRKTSAPNVTKEKTMKVTKKQYYSAVGKIRKAIGSEGMETLDEHFERDHGGCDSSNCSMTIAMNHGYSLHALECWLSSGAASPDTLEIAEKIPQKALSICSTYEAEGFCREVEHAECPCGGIVWEYSWHGDEVYCDSCGENFPNPDKNHDDEEEEDPTPCCYEHEYSELSRDEPCPTRADND